MRPITNSHTSSLRVTTLLLCSLAAGVAATGCGASDATSTVTQTVVTQVKTVHEPATTAATTNRTATPEATDAKESTDGFSMPDEVGKSLQEAQDDVQTVSGNPVFITDSSDATGAGRLQILDRNWKVCAQNVSPGARATDDSNISFDAVKLNEDCP